MERLALLHFQWFTLAKGLQQRIIRLMGLWTISRFSAGRWALMRFPALRAASQTQNQISMKDYRLIGPLMKVRAQRPRIQPTTKTTASCLQIPMVISRSGSRKEGRKAGRFHSMGPIMLRCLMHLQLVRNWSGNTPFPPGLSQTWHWGQEAVEAGCLRRVTAFSFSNGQVAG